MAAVSIVGADSIMEIGVGMSVSMMNGKQTYICWFDSFFQINTIMCMYAWIIYVWTLDVCMYD